MIVILHLLVAYVIAMSLILARVFYFSKNGDNPVRELYIFFLLLAVAASTRGFGELFWIVISELPIPRIPISAITFVIVAVALTRLAYKMRIKRK
jgi:hypothetical protein